MMGQYAYVLEEGAGKIEVWPLKSTHEMEGSALRVLVQVRMWARRARGVPRYPPDCSHVRTTYIDSVHSTPSCITSRLHQQQVDMANFNQNDESSLHVGTKSLLTLWYHLSTGPPYPIQKAFLAALLQFILNLSLPKHYLYSYRTIAFEYKQTFYI